LVVIDRIKWSPCTGTHGRHHRNAQVEGQLVFNGADALLKASLNGLGLAYLTEGHVQPYLASGRLVRVLSEWCPPFSGYHLYYPSRRQPSPAFSVLVDALRYRRN